MWYHHQSKTVADLKLSPVMLGDALSCITKIGKRAVG
jgi:hypothetical protein